MTKHDSNVGKVDPGDRVTLPVKFAWGNPSTRVTLSPCKQVLMLKSRTLFKNQHIIMEDHIPTQKGLEIQPLLILTDRSADTTYSEQDP